MTRERAKELAPIIAAYGEGKTIQIYIGNGWADLLSASFDASDEYRIKPEAKRRLMTREEVLGFVAHNPHIVIRYDGWAWRQSASYIFPSIDLDKYEWATITERGEIGEPHKFEVEDD